MFTTLMLSLHLTQRVFLTLLVNDGFGVRTRMLISILCLKKMECGLSWEQNRFTTFIVGDPPHP